MNVMMRTLHVRSAWEDTVLGIEEVVHAIQSDPRVFQGSVGSCEPAV